MSTAYIALGSNLGDRLGHLREAVRRLDALPRTHVTGASPVYETEAVTLDDSAAPPYLNAVVSVRTGLDPESLLERCLNIERAAGRVRSAGRRWESRSLDLDLLVIDDLSIDSGRLLLPHPRMGERRFVLQPLFDLAPDLHLPDPYDVSVRYLLDRCTDREPLGRFDIRLLDVIANP